MTAQHFVITAIIPAYNEAGRVGKTVKRVAPYVDEIIVVDDASTDNTAAEARTAGAQVVQNQQNMGYIYSIKRGFTEAQGNIVITFDADGEFPADSIPRLVQPILDNEADMVQGHRDIVPRPSERFLTWFACQIGQVGDSGTGLRALRTELAQRLELIGSCICGIFALEVLSKGGRITEIPIELQSTDKSRRIAWHHLKQFFYILRWLVK